MSINEKPAGISGGQVTRSGQPSCPLDNTITTIEEQLYELLRQIEEIDKSSDYPAWESARVTLLNAQADAWNAGFRSRAIGGRP